ncbi:MAG TPA: polysaccharide deacetylase family protein [Blastocatellia bacterium]|nr:polysaccharide deacetylase family protein [Blastocatellia bacterium]
MRHNPFLKKLGFDAADRVVVIHVDDIGMCHATLPAFFDLVGAGLVSSGSVMVPCPWFPEAASHCRARPLVDVGVHLTLTSEWDGYRWGPLSTRDPASGLVDTEGYFYRNQSMWERPDAGVIRAEMTAQVDQARKAGLDLTHLDCHMFAALDTRLVGEYVGLGFERGLPVLMVKQPQWVEILSERAISEWEEQGLPVFDHLREMYLNKPAEGRLDQAKEVFDNLPPGLTFFMTHPAHDTPELRAIAADWQQRVADYETFMSSGLRDHVRNSGIQVIGWRALRDAMRAGLRPDSPPA